MDRQRIGLARIWLNQERKGGAKFKWNKQRKIMKKYICVKRKKVKEKIQKEGGDYGESVMKNVDIEKEEQLERSER